MNHRLTTMIIKLSTACCFGIILIFAQPLSVIASVRTPLATILNCSPARAATAIESKLSHIEHLHITNSLDISERNDISNLGEVEINDHRDIALISSRDISDLGRIGSFDIVHIKIMDRANIGAHIDISNLSEIASNDNIGVVRVIGRNIMNNHSRIERIGIDYADTLDNYDAVRVSNHDISEIGRIGVSRIDRGRIMNSHDIVDLKGISNFDDATINDHLDTARTNYIKIRLDHAQDIARIDHDISSIPDIIHNGLIQDIRNENRSTQQSNDEQAQQEMRARISHDGRVWSPIQKTFGIDANWLPGWELRWSAFRRDDGRTVWAYHARLKSSGDRYTSFIDPNTGQLQKWESVQ